MKFTDLKEKKVYKRIEDGIYFKMIDDKYLKFEGKKWEVTEDLKLSDEFEITHQDPSLDCFEHLYRDYQGSTYESQKRKFEDLLLKICRELDKGREDGTKED